MLDVVDLIDALSSHALSDAQVMSELLRRERQIDVALDHQRRYYERTIDELYDRIRALELMASISWEQAPCA